MAATSKVEFTLKYTDGTTNKLTIGSFAANSSALNNIKSNVIDFLQNDFTSDTASLTLSKYNNEWSGFESVKIITTDKNVIF